jgi:hypothetical protein
MLMTADGTLGKGQRGNLERVHLEPGRPGSPPIAMTRAMFMDGENPRNAPQWGEESEVKGLSEKLW